MEQPTKTACRSERLDADDLAALADEATRQGLSLACLIAAMESGETIAWMEEE